MKRLLRTFFAFGCGLAWLGAPAAQAQVQAIPGQFLGESATAANLPRVLSVAPKQVLPLFHPRAARSGAAVNDPALQQTTGPKASIVRGVNVEGLGSGFPGYTVNLAPPDTNAAAGPTQVVETVNISYVVFDKTTGTAVTAPIAFTSLFAGAGNNCEVGFQSDPVVLYDKFNGRWVITFLAATNGGPIGVSKPFLQCFAVSTTSDATGSYFLYAFDVTGLAGGTAGALNDYGKMGVWPDAYYMSFNEFTAATGVFKGASPCAFQSSAMVAGATASAVCFLPLASEDSLLPSDSDGLPPPAGSPNFYIGTLNGSSSFNLWRFHVDFTTPSNSTFTGPTTLVTGLYSEACGGDAACIPQPTGGEVLDSLGDRMMFRAAYRNFSNLTMPHEAIVVSHSVVAGSSVGVRWYEIRSPNGTPFIFQQGTFAPDANFRWMGSVAMDKVNDIAVGYSVSSSSVFPGIRVSNRTPNMSPGTLSAEATIMSGHGVQQNTGNRWGDYSSMSVDPVDDCTFWYAQEYIRSTGSFDWNTRLASFKLSRCF